MANEKHTLLIIEDDLDVAEMLNAYFRVQGYEVLTASWGEDGIQAAIAALPDLIILDIRLPDIDGFEVATRLRETNRTARIPILFLTDQRQRTSRIQGLELGADDYITKPFDIQELRLRVRNSLRRASQGSVSNPITGLPEGNLVDERLQALQSEPGAYCLLLVRIRNLNRFREAYGFVASDDVLRAICLMIQSIVHELGSSDDFLGHLAVSDIIVVTKTEKAAEIEAYIRGRLPLAIDLFYPVSSRESGETADRVGIAAGKVCGEGMNAAGDLGDLKKILVESLV